MWYFNQLAPMEMSYSTASGGVAAVIPADRLCRNGYISQFFTHSFKLVFPANAGIQYNINPLKDWIPAYQTVSQWLYLSIFHPFFQTRLSRECGNPVQYQ